MLPLFFQLKMFLQNAQHCEKYGAEILWRDTVLKKETMRKLCLSTKFPDQGIRWNYGVLRGARPLLEFGNLLNPFTANASFLYPLNTSENLKVF